MGEWFLSFSKLDIKTFQLTIDIADLVHEL